MAMGTRLVGEGCIRTFVDVVKCLGMADEDQSRGHGGSVMM